MVEIAWVVVIVGVILIVILSFLILIEKIQKAQEEEKKNKEEKEREERRRIEQEKNRAEYVLQQKIETLMEQYGQLSHIIRFENVGENADVAKLLLVFAESSVLYIGGRIILFKDIITYSITDDYRIKHGDVKYTTETDTSTGSLLGRSIAGAVLLGGVGAVIGASSASKNGTTIGIRKDDEILHQYFLSINVRSMENPLIRISLGGSAEIAEKVNAILACIVECAQTTK